MSVETVTLQIPEILYQRLLNTARATQRPLEEVMLDAIKIGSPPEWDNMPAEFQAEIATLDWCLYHHHIRCKSKTNPGKTSSPDNCKGFTNTSTSFPKR
jgi:hypothetical protein